MKHKIIPAVIIALLIGCFLCGTASAAISGSGNSWSDPYVIETADDLRQLSGDGYAAFTRAGYFVLNDDIEFEDNDAVFVPIGSNINKFIGHFDGQNNKIIGLRTTGDPTGLFAYVSSGASISNIEFHNAQITGTGIGGTGVLYGQCYGATSQVTVNNVNVYDSKVTSSNGIVGGIAGFGATTNSQATITSCNVKGCVITSSSSGHVGGIAGYGAATNSQATITSCNVEDCVMSAVAFGIVGGIAGDGAVSSGQANYVSCHVKNCYLFAMVSVEGWCGGIVGNYYSSGTGSITGCTVEKCTIRSAWECAGGILGGARGNAVTISNCAVSDSTIIAANSYGAGVCPQW